MSINLKDIKDIYFVDYIFDEMWYGHTWRFTPIRRKYVNLGKIIMYGISVTQEDLKWLYKNTFKAAPWAINFKQSFINTSGSMIVKIDDNHWVYLEDGVNCGLIKEAREILKDNVGNSILELSIFR